MKNQSTHALSPVASTSLPPNPNRIVRRPEVERVTGMSRSTIYLRITEGLFPRPISLGARMVGWRESEVAAINAARIRGAPDEEIRSLVRQLEIARKEAA